MVRGRPSSGPSSSSQSLSGQAPSGQARSARFEAEALASIDSLYRTALRLTRAPAEAEDLVQDTYLRAFRAADRFEPGTNLKAWLFTILHNLSRNRRRDRARDIVTANSEVVDRAADRPLSAGAVAGAGAGAGRVPRFAGAWRSAGRSPGGSPGGSIETPETLLLRDTLAPDLKAALDELPDAFRQAVWLRDVEEFSYGEIAEMVAIPIGTVMSRISRGRRMLFDTLSESRSVATAVAGRAGL